VTGVRVPYEAIRSEPSVASHIPFTHHSSMMETHSSPQGTPQDMEYSVACPYACGTVLTGIHAVGNLTRHLKSRACPNSLRRSVEYPCPIHGCMNKYSRSDGCKSFCERRLPGPLEASLGRAAASVWRHLVLSCADHIARLVKVHMRRRHGAPPPEPKAGSPTDE
jgi:hypothetical protein